MANKSHQMTMPDSHFNSGMIPLCHAVLSSIDFFPLLGHRKEKKMTPAAAGTRAEATDHQG